MANHLLQLLGVRMRFHNSIAARLVGLVFPMLSAPLFWVAILAIREGKTVAGTAFFAFASVVLIGGILFVALNFMASIQIEPNLVIIRRLFGTISFRPDEVVRFQAHLMNDQKSRNNGESMLVNMRLSSGRELSLSQHFPRQAYLELQRVVPKFAQQGDSEGTPLRGAPDL